MTTTCVRTVLLSPVAGTVSVDEHTRTRLPAPARLSQLCDVLIAHGTGAPQALATAASHPGVLVVAVHQGSRGWIRLGPQDTVCELEVTGAGDPEDAWATLASLAHAWLVAGLAAAEFGSMPLGVLRVHASGSPSSGCRSRRRAASASSARPTEA